MAMMLQRSFLLATLILLLGLGLVVRSVAATTTSATPELPLLPPLDRGNQQAAATTVDSESQQTQVDLLMIRLIRSFFGENQMKWSPFIQHNQVRSHHRIVHEHGPHPHLQEQLARRRFHLRGNKVMSSNHP